MCTRGISNEPGNGKQEKGDRRHTIIDQKKAERGGRRRRRSGGDGRCRVAYRKAYHIRNRMTHFNALVARAIRVYAGLNDTRFTSTRLDGTLCTLFGADGHLRRQRKTRNCRTRIVSIQREQ